MTYRLNIKLLFSGYHHVSHDALTTAGRLNQVPRTWCVLLKKAFFVTFTQELPICSAALIPNLPFREQLCMCQESIELEG